MKNISFKTLLPHLVAIAVFLLVAVIFCKPALESGVVMQQSDYAASDAMKHQSVTYKEQHGAYPLWSASMFCGMPAYQIIYDGPWSPIGIINGLFQLYLPKPLNFFFLSCICFYFLCLCLRIRPYAAILGALAYTYSTYTPIIAVAGHDTKVLAMAYAPALIGAIILIFDKKYIAGFILTALFATLHLQQNHQQISFYTFLIIAIMSLFYLVRWIKAKEFAHLSKAIGIAAAGAIIGIMANAVILFPVMDYAKYTKRGGQLIMDNKTNVDADKIVDNKTVGLTKDYAFSWSYGKEETFSIMFPGVMGYGTHIAQRDGDYSIFPQLNENSHVAQYLTDKLSVPEDQATNLANNLSTKLYWGDQPFTVGPFYFGAIICFLFILGLFIVDAKHKWWILAASIFAVLLALGNHFESFNYFIFDHLPFYNKFRTPSMTLVIPQLLFPLLAVLAIDKLMDNSSGQWKNLQKALIATAAVFVCAAGIYFTTDYSKENKARTKAVTEAFATPADANAKLQAINNNPLYKPETDNSIYEDFLYQSKGDAKIARELLSSLRKDRQSYFGADILRALIFVALAFALIALFTKGKITATILLIAMPVLVLADLLPFDMHYLNDKDFDNKDAYEAKQYPKTAADEMILKDQDPNYRVLNLTDGDPFQDAKTSYYHKSIGGYHPAKLGIYDDLITYQLSGQPNPAVLNMLNTKYIIQQNQQSTIALPNSGALGNCWFVKGVKYVETPTDEMKSLNSFNPADTAVINTEFKNIVGTVVASDSTASIKQITFDNEAIKYESNSNSNNLAVFSEIFYKDWKAYIDGKETPIAKANYVLRALPIPAGKHTIEFKFEPKIFKLSYGISEITGWVMFLLLIWFGYYTLKKEKQAA
ncbi:YfhO family protein [Ferruginibacter albus]|uniref:YfhO family protein n=1 Tax=Ferruginibacter albus TaxID=2875540 RepID=UPI001CC3BF68|nr:YfhO family protein [Ferruginibacter albus]UAY53164.1 YfhO family protein [Ferruginibacter albus]